MTRGGDVGGCQTFPPVVFIVLSFFSVETRATRPPPQVRRRRRVKHVGQEEGPFPTLPVHSLPSLGPCPSCASGGL